jgi:hypothetical protein
MEIFDERSIYTADDDRHLQGLRRLIELPAENGRSS